MRTDISSYLKRNWLFLLGSLFLIILVFIESNGEKDLRVFLWASDNMWNGGNIYQDVYKGWLHYYYDVSFAILITPLSYLPIYWANVIWSLTGLLLTYRTWKIIEHYLPIEQLGEKAKKLLPFLAFIIVFALWYKNIRYTQLTIVILYLTLESIYQIDRKKWALGGFLLALGITIKILPIVIIPYLLYRSNFKGALTTIIFIFMLLLLPSFIIGHDYNVFLLKERWGIINPLNSEHVLDVSERSFHSITSLFSSLFVENARNSYTLDYKRNIADVNLETLGLIINIGRAFFIVLTLWFLRSMPFKKVSSLQRIYELSYILLVVPMLFPHQQHYAFYFIYPAIGYLVFYFLIKYKEVKNSISSLKKYSLLFVFFFIFSLLSSHFTLGAFRELYDHYKTLTYGVLLLIPLLAIARPNKLNLTLY